jgi:hypothetical protein
MTKVLRRVICRNLDDVYRKAFAIVTAVVLTSSSVLSFVQPQMSYASTIDYRPLTYVLLLNPECDWEYRDQFAESIRVINTGFEQYISDQYHVVCLGGVDDLSDIESYILPVLRPQLPYSKFVFVYPDIMTGQYYDYIEGKYGLEYRYRALGNTDLPKGIAYVSEAPANVKHEMAHLATCGTWHDDRGEDIGRIVKHPEAGTLPWC